MHRVKSDKQIKHARFYREYRFFLAILVVIATYAFVLDTPSDIFRGLIEIVTSRSLLVTDYMAVGGPGAMLLNGALAGGFTVLTLIIVGVKPNGATIMAMWITVGFGFFGKNIFNMWPLTFGVWLYARFQKEPFINYSLAAVLVATLSPVVSELAFGFNTPNPWIGIGLGLALGVFTGFVFPMISAFVIRVHDGYDLYNMGFAGGAWAMLLVAGLKAAGITIETAELWATGYNAEMAGLIYFLCICLVAGGFIIGRGKDHVRGIKKINKASGRLVSDYYTLYGETAYINMGLLGILATTMTLALGIDVNGPTMGGIMTIMAFGSFGKHVKNVLPIMSGAILGALANTLDITAPGNALAILFSTGLAPIAGQFGIIWGIVAGFVHVTMVLHTGYMSSGLNLYNNGFAGGLVAMILVPIIVSIKKSRE